MKKPNLLFVFSDQQHWQAVGYADAAFETPALDRLAAEGIVCSHAFCTTPQCSPSRASMLTGQYPSKTGVLGNVGQAGGAPLRMPTLGQRLREAGYRTGYFGKWHLGDDPVGIAGWDVSAGIHDGGLHDGTEITRKALDFLSASRSDDRPFALFLSYNNPHDIYHFGREKPPVPSGANALPHSWDKKNFDTVPAVQHQFMREDQGRVIVEAERQAWERYRELYREKVKLYDADVDQVLSALDAADLADRTLVVATSDHGDMDTHHRLIYKGPFMYEQMMRVPLIFRLPGRQSAGRVVDFLTSNVDLAPTLADFAGFALPETDGLSLHPLLEGSGVAPQRDAVIGQYYSKQKWVNPIRMIRTRRYKYNRYRVHGEELYDLLNDPDELHNLSTDPAHANVLADLSAQLDDWLRAHHDPFETQHPTTRSGEPLLVEE